MANQKYCRNCGSPNPQDAKFCLNCSAAFVSAAVSQPRSAPSAAPSPVRQQPPYSPSPQPRTMLGLSRKMIVVGIVVIVLLLTLGCVALMATTTTTSPTATPKATAAPTVKATATKATPTAAPTATTSPVLSSFNGLLVEHPASVSGDDKSADINKEEQSSKTLVTPFHRATIDGRDVYIGVIYNDQGQKLTYYMFPLGSFSEARDAQSAYVKQFEAKGFTKLTDDTSMSKEESVIQLQAPSGSGTMYIDALGFQADLGGPAMDIYYALSSQNSAA